MFLRCCVGNTLNTHSRSGEYPSETRWTFKQIKLVQKIEIQIDGFNLYLTGWQVPLPHSPAKWNIAVAPRQGRGEVCTGHSRSSRLLCLLFWMMGKINETRALIPSTHSFIIPANIVNKNFSFFKVLLSCQIMSLMNNDLRAECCLCCCVCQSDIVEWLIIIWWSELAEVRRGPHGGRNSRSNLGKCQNYSATLPRCWEELWSVIKAIREHEMMIDQLLVDQVDSPGYILNSVLNNNL